ncbi:SAV_2336 N-terminal domain-related protein [Nonomuraea jabiensis]|uniref:SAV_2336 N-terminal domain-related protein n=1 Tax=Nonomuraea jabiensis TaxID=882448 RepID=UPI003D722098
MVADPFLQLHNALRAADPDLTVQELAEIVWLAGHLSPTHPTHLSIEPEAGPSPHADAMAHATGSAAAEVAPEPEPDSASLYVSHDLHDSAATRSSRRNSQTEHAHNATPGDRLSIDGDSDALPVQAPSATMLGDILAVQRALRPLKQHRASSAVMDINEAATADWIADTGQWMPIFTPVAERWLDLTLVADTGPSMLMWAPLVEELCEALAQLGAFRDIQVYFLSGTGISRQFGGPSLPPQTLIDPSGRRLVLVLSDCSGRRWWNGRAQTMLHKWARHGPVAVLQPLPERMWRRTALPAVPGIARPVRRAAPNTRLGFTPREAHAAAPEGIPIPVVELTPPWLASWARLIAGPVGDGLPTSAAYVKGTPHSREQRTAKESTLSAVDRVRRFRAVASPQAIRLAVSIATSTPTLPVMRLIQRVMLPKGAQHPQYLAEVLLSGLLRPVGDDRYAFVEGARAALLATSPRSESLDVINRISAHVENQAGFAAHAFTALLPVPHGMGERHVRKEDEPFALISPEAVRILTHTAVPLLGKPSGVPVPSGQDNTPFWQQMGNTTRRDLPHGRSDKALRLSVDSLRISSSGTALAETIADYVHTATGRRASSSEVSFWQRSLPVLVHDLADAGLHRVEMLVEYKLPLTSKRVNVVLAGIHPRTGEDSYVVIELKQWTRAQLSDAGAHLVVAGGRSGGETLDPVEQVRRYCEYMRDFLEILHDKPDAVDGAAYLYNAMDMDVDGLADQVQEEHGRLFTKQRRGEFLRYLSERLSSEPGANAADRLLNSAVAPGKQLMTYASKEIREREQFTLLDEQQVAFELVMAAVVKARRADSKQVVIITGGPGSGKSVIALSLLGELLRQGRSALHATGSQSFTQTMRRYPGRGSTQIKNLFKYFNSFTDAEQNGLDVLICDEAHRIRETSANRFTPAEKRTGRSQLDELLSAARVPVFLLDQHQNIRPGDIGTVDSIARYARAKGYGVHLISLNDQFRSGGSRKYEQWVLRLLDLADGGPMPWDGDEDFEVRLADSPQELEAFLRAQSGTARMTAGYCWPWSDPRSDDSLVNDIVIGDWARPWSVKSDRAVGGFPPSMLWASDPNGFGQVGTIYAAQAFEYDWNGVILGPDLAVRNGRLVTERWANKDPAFRSRESVPDSDFDRLVRNVYKVLLTRGMQGTVIYAVDPDLRDFLTTLM